MNNDKRAMTNLFLIGYRCTGKSSVARLVAEKLGWDFVDADERMMKNTGESVAEIVSKGGWPLFRELEKDTLRSICLNSRQVVATGGGVVEDDENIDLMKQNGVVVWLRACSRIILERMVGDTHTRDLRPPLTDRELKGEIEETLKKRTPLYRAAMTLEVDTGGKTLPGVSSEVISLLNSIGSIEIPPDTVS